MERIILVGGGAREREEQGGDCGGGGRRRLAWRAEDAWVMNQLSKYGPCFSSPHTHPLPVQSGQTSLLLVYLSLSLSHIYCSNLITVMEESPRVNRSHILTKLNAFFQPTATTIY